MGNQQAKVGLRLDKETYQAGGVITGRVYLSLPKQHQQRSSSNNSGFANIERLHLLFTGIEYAQVARKPNHRHSKHQRHHHHHHHDNEPIIEKSTHVLVRNDFPLVDLRTVKAGQYEYPFELPVLSAELPSSITCYDSTNKKSFCEIRYTLLAYLAQQQPGPLQQEQLPSITSGYIPLRLTAAPRDMESPQPPRPLIMETESYPVHTCCFWNKGHLELGWQANTSQVAPGEHVQVQAVGQNLGQLEVDSITVKWVETITWKTAGGDKNSECRRRTNKRILAEQKIAVHQLVAWAPQRQDLTMNNITTTTTTPIQFNLQLPTDARDSYSGPAIHVRHMLIVRVNTAGGFTTTSPESACQIRVRPKCRRCQSFCDEPTTVVPVTTMVDLQPATPPPPPPQSTTTTTTTTTANHPYDTQNIVHAQVLPTDWNPIQSDVVVIPQAAAVLIDEDVVILPSVGASAPLEQDLYMNNNNNNNNDYTGRGSPTMMTLPATSATMYQASAPKESSIMANQEEERIPLNPTATRDNNALMTRQLRTMISETPENLVVVLGESDSNGNENDAWLNAVRNLDPRDYCSLVAAAPPKAAAPVALTLATAMGAQFQCRHVLACLWSLPDGADNVRMSVACAVGNLPADLSLANRRLMEQELRGNELTQFRQATMRG